MFLGACTDRHVASDTDDDAGDTGVPDDATTSVPPSTTSAPQPLPPGEDTATTAAPDEPCGNGELDRGEGCDDGNREPDDGCLPDCTTGRGTPSLPVWVGGPWPFSLAALDGTLAGAGADALLLAGTGQLELVPLAPGPTAWTLFEQPPRSYTAVAFTVDGDIVTAGVDMTLPPRIWLGRSTLAGAERWTHDYPDLRFAPMQVLLAPGGDIVVFEAHSGIHVFDRDGALRWSHVAPPGSPSGISYEHVTLAADGTLHVVGSTPAALIVDALDPQGALLWRRELESPRQLSSPRAVETPSGGLLVVMSQKMPGMPAPFEIAALAQFDAAGTLQWWRDDELTSAEDLSPADVVAMPGGGAFVAWRHITGFAFKYAIGRYDPTGARLYLHGAQETVLDLAPGPDGRVYSLEIANGSAQVVPYLP
ncbi:PQQ-binding-like beta-propeller repeat protein [Nannocystis sp. SCPEA4]|nr:PQQ-binding-like beta-propeller repeat protein [Nannocystis sp. SCPEA4]